MRRSTIQMSLAGLCLSALASFAFAAGDHGDHGGHGAMPEMTGDMGHMHEEMEAALADTSAFGEKGNAAGVTRTIAIEASEIKFDTTILEIGVGETVSFVITNKGEQPHEFTIGDAAYQGVARQMMTMMADMGMDLASPEHMEMHAAAGNTLVLEPGQTASVVWHFTKPGEFLFACNFIGHSEAGMAGTILVK